MTGTGCGGNDRGGASECARTDNTLLRVGHPYLNPDSNPNRNPEARPKLTLTLSPALALA